MEPEPPCSARENLLRLLDRLFSLLMQATLARESRDHPAARKLIRGTTAAFEEMNAALAAVDEETRKELMPLVLEATAAEALLMANAHAAERNLLENRLHYGTAIQASRRVGDPAYQGRALSCYGAVLLYFEEYTEAATQLQLARQYLRSDELGAWVQATTWLAYAYLGLNRLTDAIAVLHETVSPFNQLPYQRPRALTSHHIAAAMLLARLWVRNRERKSAKELLERIQKRVEPLHALHSTPEYEQFLILRSIGFRRYESRQPRHPRTMLI